jgi:N-acetylmuramic acid 6-phosphate (MurNAc-6-P) etherase
VIVSDATGLSEAAAADLLGQCDGEIKTAIAASLLRLTPVTARAQLQAAQGNLVATVKP